MSDRRFFVGGHSLAAPALSAGLYLVATPIGNLKDITLRALEVLAGADIIACEDSRVSGKLLHHFGITDKKLVRYDEHQGAAARPKLLQSIEGGASVALISDAGTPLISDPGFKLVREARERGLSLVPLPGASALLAGLVGAGLASDRFSFEGFLPNKQGERRARLEKLKNRDETLIFYERFARMPAFLADLAAVLGEREIAVGRELTKLYEEFIHGTCSEVIHQLGARDVLKGEAVVLVEGAKAEAGFVLGSPELDAMIRAAMAEQPVKGAAASLAEVTGLPRRDLYARALSLKAKA